MRGGTGLAKMTMINNSIKNKNRVGGWSIVRNEENRGSNMYQGGYPTIASEMISRKRIMAKEVSP